MNKDSCFYVGFVSKKIGFKGKISIKINHGNPKNYLNIDFIYIDKDNQLIPYKVISLNLKKNLFLELKLEEIDNETMVNSLIKKDVYLDKNKFQKKDEFSYQELINYIVFDSSKNIGLVKDLIHQKEQKLIIVENQKNHEIIIPLVQSFIKEIDEKNKILKLILPKGLTDLNRK
tara:strand:+ start:100 stop:621 length:522 start_codon:yes stop_codon:yes gene_type:complete